MLFKLGKQTSSFQRTFSFFTDICFWMQTLLTASNLFMLVVCVLGIKILQPYTNTVHSHSVYFSAATYVWGVYPGSCGCSEWKSPGCSEPWPSQSGPPLATQSGRRTPGLSAPQSQCPQRPGAVLQGPPHSRLAPLWGNAMGKSLETIKDSNEESLSNVLLPYTIWSDKTRQVLGKPTE